MTRLADAFERVVRDADLYHARVLGTHPDGEVSWETSQVMAGVQWLADQGCTVVNLSLGGVGQSRTERALYAQLHSEGTMIVAAAGKRVVPVWATQLDMTASSPLQRSTSTTRSPVLEHRPGLDLAGPGVLVLSSVPSGQAARASVTASGTTRQAFGMEFAGTTSETGFTDTLVNCGLATKEKL